MDSFWFESLGNGQATTVIGSSSGRTQPEARDEGTEERKYLPRLFWLQIPKIQGTPIFY
jgi:hypothetical protein